MEDYNKWETDVTGHLCELTACYYSDASAIIEANEFYLSQCWGKGMTAIETAKTIYVNSKQKNVNA